MFEAHEDYGTNLEALQLDDSKEKEVAQAVIKDIKAIGEGFSGIKQQNEKINKEFHDFKEVVERQAKEGVDKTSSLVKEQITKFGEDISTRQEQMDAAIQKMNDRADAIETAMKRVPLSGPGDGSSQQEMYAATKEFMLNTMVAGAGDAGVTAERFIAAPSGSPSRDR